MGIEEIEKRLKAQKGTRKSCAFLFLRTVLPPATLIPQGGQASGAVAHKMPQEAP
ncbi:hypothetical protein [Caballeronia udeis]|uniref:hypothetical protein n=1 Tax=Caballeronia udeis TaxID=1232866 RepID=UPI000B03531C|nr:hypothetical protein [Caballeronia udeis]